MNDFSTERFFAIRKTEGSARLRVNADTRREHSISPYLTGKFCEHLGSNIYNGMCAQILRNPTFSEYPFAARGTPPDGGKAFECDPERTAEQIGRQAQRLGLPENEVKKLSSAYFDSLAFWWQREESDGKVSVEASPDTGPHGGRAQRVETESGGGIYQWVYLPLHRVKDYHFEIIARSADLDALKVTLCNPAGKIASEAAASGLGDDWKRVEGELHVGEGFHPASLYRIALTSEKTGQFVIDRFLLWPADHVDGADPDVIALLKGSNLPVLRWPGGNFVSAYFWEDGIGPPERRPTRPNYAWGGVEPNIFGTDEFMLFCKNVGCEPMICINAGTAGPEEAARWVEYCNGPADTEQGRLRASNGHPEPYGVRFWEIGNELYGKWQNGWATPSGYADRFRRFVKAMRAVDPSMLIYANGAPVFTRHDWNDALFESCADILRRTTDHALVGGTVTADMDPLDVFADFMAYPMAFEEKYRRIQDHMEEAGVKEPRMAITELQLFAHLRGGRNDGPGTLGRSNLVSPHTLAEALYVTLYYHSGVRLAPFLEMITHSATVNHGGGLRKERERVYANPCHYARALFSRFAGALPVASELATPFYVTPLVLTDLMATGFGSEVPILDAVTAVDRDGRLLISVVNRSGREVLDLEVELEGFQEAGRESGKAALTTISGDLPWSSNSLREPEAIKPETAEVKVEDGKLRLAVPRHSVVQVEISL